MHFQVLFAINNMLISSATYLLEIMGSGKKNRFTGGPESRLFTFFSRLPQEGKRTKTKAVWSSCRSILFGVTIN